MTRRPIATLTATLLLALAARSANAQFAVIDAGNLIQNTTTALSTAQTLINTYTQIEQLRSQIQNQLQTLATINPTSFSDLKRLLATTQVIYSDIQGSLTSISYNVGDVNRDFNALFPKNQSAWRSVRSSDFANYYDRWNAEVNSSSIAAARAQSSITSLDRNNQAIANIRTQSNAAPGEVRQLQLVNQQLAIIHTELVSLAQNLTTMGRVLSNWAAASVGEKMLGRESKQRRIEGYTNRGRPARVLNRLP
jgi:P-type conjugative transfer protein TrbJ